MKLAVANVGDGKPEIVYTIQGEGPTIGTPSIFVRLAGCNLHCRWCDAFYTWNWEGTPYKHDWAPKVNPKDEIIQMEHTDIAKEIKKFSQCRNVVFTGGEPLLQASGIVAVIRSLDGYRYEIETNGTKTPEEYLSILVHQFNVSPKLENSGNSKKEREDERALRAFSKMDKAWFKFVIVTPQDLEETLSLIKRFAIRRNRVLLMPEGITSEEINKKSEWLVEICKQYGFRFTTRAQILLYGRKRGT